MFHCYLHHWTSHYKQCPKCVESPESIESIAIAALEKIEDPRKMDHTERDEYTRTGCLMNVAHEAMEKIRKIKGVASALDNSGKS